MSEKAGWKDRLFGGLKKTSGKLTDNITGLVTKSKLDAEDLDEIEDALIASDLGPAMAAQIRDKIRELEKRPPQNEAQGQEGQGQEGQGAA